MKDNENWYSSVGLEIPCFVQNKLTAFLFVISWKIEEDKAQVLNEALK